MTIFDHNNDLFYVKGEMVFRGFCKSQHDKTLKNRFTVELTNDSADNMRTIIGPLYKEAGTYDKFIPTIIKDKTVNTVGFNSAFKVKIYEKGASESTCDIYSINTGAKVIVALRIKVKDDRVSFYPVAICIEENGEEFNPFQKDMSEEVL